MTSNPVTTPEKERVAHAVEAHLDKLLAFAFGVIFVSVLLYLATVEKNPTPLAVQVYVTVLALASAGVGAMLPGFLEVQYKNLFRAGGAIGLGALVYLNQPAIAKNVVNIVEPTVAPDPVVTAFLDAIDTGDPARSWTLLSSTSRDQVSGGEAAWAQLYQTDIAPLGKTESRTLIGQNRAESPPGVPLGLYRSFSYKTRFLNDSGFRLENVVVRANSKDAWEIFSYQISPTTFARLPEGSGRPHPALAQCGDGRRRGFA